MTRTAFFAPTLQRRRNHAKDVRAPLYIVEVELRQVLSYMGIGVFTRQQLRRELRRCAEMGKPWPLVLAVIPDTKSRREAPAPLARFTAKAIAGEPGLA